MSKHSLYIIIAGVFWGIIPIFVDSLSAQGLTSLQIVAVRVCVCAPVFVLYCVIKDRNLLKIKLKHIPWFLATGVLSIVLFNYFYFECIKVSGSPAVSALLLYTAPVFVMIMSVIFFKEKITAQKICGLALAVVGLVFVTGAFTQSASLSFLALMLGLGSGFCYALYSIFGKNLLNKYPPVTVTAYTFIFAAIAVVPVSGILNNMQVFADVSVILPALSIGVLCTFLPFAFYTNGLVHTEPGKAAMLATVEPVIASVVAFTVFGEQLTSGKVVGIVLILMCMIVLTIQKKNATNLEK